MKLKAIIMGLVTLVSAAEVNAQQLVTRVAEGGFYAIAGSLTNDNKGRLFAAESVMENGDFAYGKCIIYNTSMQEEATGIFRPQLFSRKYGKLIAKSNIKATDVVTLGDTYSSYVYSVDQAKSYYNVDPTTAEGLKEFIKKYNGTESLISFTDAKGRIAVAEANPYNYFNYDMFGTAFIENYYTVEGDNVIRIVNYYRIDYSIIENIDTSGLTWSVDDSYETEEYTESNHLVGAEIFNIDNGDNNVDVKSTYATQNLFNKDNKWEYLMTAYDAAYPAASEGSHYEYVQPGGVSEDGYMMVYKYGNLPGSTLPNCIKIVQFDGTCIATFPMSSFYVDYDEDDLQIFVIGGKPYFCIEEEDKDNDKYYSCLYNFDPATRQFNIVRKTPVATKKVISANRQTATKTNNSILRNIKK